MNTTLINNAKIVNEGKIVEGDVLVKDGIIFRINNIPNIKIHRVIDANGQYLIPGLIDDQVHFREPGLTKKATIFTEARAAVAGGITSFMEMPNTIPNTLTQDLLEQKYQVAANQSLANYSFYMGVSNDNLEEVLKTDSKSVCGIKVFMGSSTGNMLVDDENTLQNIFSKVSLPIATHCEDELTIINNLKKYRELYGDDIPIEAHPLIRSREACLKSSSLAVSLAKKYNARLHVLHISTAEELALFDNNIPLEEKKITSEACIHHLWFNNSDYSKKGALIKWNPAIKTQNDQKAILDAVRTGLIDVIATDHAPHTLNEKMNNYMNTPSGGPLVQHSLYALLEMYLNNQITLEAIVKLTAHNPAMLFNIYNRGFIREGYFADIVLVDLNSPSWVVKKENILAKCGWSPFEGTNFHSTITHTFVSGHLAYQNGHFNGSKNGKRLFFNR